jgi:hypothetical protein
MVAGHTGRTKSLHQFRRAGQRVGQDPDHGLLDLHGGEPPALRAIRSGLGDQDSGDVVAIASPLLDGVGWREALSPCIDQQARQEARLGCFRPVPMVARVGCKLVPNNGPGRIIDQRRLLARVELTLVHYLAGVNWVREQCIEMTAREGLAAALGAIRRYPAFRPKPETVGLLLDPTHAAELTIESEDAAHGLGLGRVDDECPLVGVIAPRHVAAHPHALLF